MLLRILWTGPLPKTKSYQAPTLRNTGLVLEAISGHYLDFASTGQTNTLLR